MIFKVIFWGLVNCLSTAFSVAITGKKSIIGGNLLEWKNFISLLFSWEFILSMGLALIARFSFLFLNSAILKIPAYENQATTITTYILSINYVFIFGINYYYLNEVPSLNQYVGVGLIIFGIFFIIK